MAGILIRHAPLEGARHIFNDHHKRSKQEKMPWAGKKVYGVGERRVSHLKSLTTLNIFAVTVSLKLHQNHLDALPSKRPALTSFFWYDGLSNLHLNKEKLLWIMKKTTLFVV